MKAGQIRRSGGFSDLQKRQDFEGRAPRLHETLGSSTCGSPATTRFKQKNPRVLIETLTVNHGRSYNQLCVCPMQWDGWSRLITLRIDCMSA